MLFVTSLISSGVAYAYVKQRQEKHKEDEGIIVDSSAESATLEAEAEQARHYMNISTLALGTTIVGALATSPALALLTIPLNVYTTLPLYQEAIATLGGETEKRGSLLAAMVISGSLATNYLGIAGILDWGTHRWRLSQIRWRQNGAELSQILSDDLQSWVRHAMGQPPETVLVRYGNTEQIIPFAELQVGDTIVCKQGEFAPVYGRIVDGAAEVFDLTSINMPTQSVGKDDAIEPRRLLLSGVLIVEVKQIP